MTVYPSVHIEGDMAGRLSLDDAMRGLAPGNLPSPSPTTTLSSTSIDDRASTPASSQDDEPLSSATFEPIAIVGMGMRLPGGVRTDKEFWDFLIEKKDGRCKVPGTRYSVDAFYHESKQHSVKTQYGYFLQEDPAFFDTGFFSIGSFEAARLDPQQRLLMEVIWECMESAGQTGWRGDNVGCYVGVYGEDWLDLNSKDIHWIDRYHVLGTGNFALSNRISYEYDLRGPSMTLQTGCSSSLVGLHEACIAIQAGDCSSAIVAGTNLIFTPTMTTTMSDNGVLAPDGICKTFDAAANGYGRGEAVNALYIKPLKEALRAGDPVRAIIRSSSTNCDGKTPSITTPGSESQKRLIKKAYERAGIDDITETAFFECHGTGTVIGDKNEVSVVADLFGSKGVYIGAVKPNVGHSEGASGLTSVIKGVLSLEKNVIPPNAHFKDPSPEIPFKSARLQVPIEATPWPEDRKQRVSVNCFGIGGANAHVILESASSLLPPVIGTNTRTVKPQEDSLHLLLLSASSSSALKSKATLLKEYKESQSLDIEDLAYTLAFHREHLSHRTFLIGNKNEIHIPDQLSVNKSNFSPSVTYVFTGQGAQWTGMGKDLLENYDQFASDIKKMDDILKTVNDPPQWTIEQELLAVGDDSRVNEAELSQTLCTAVQIAIVNLLSSWGIQPNAVVGHSSGEIAAAYASNALTFESAIIVAYYRGQMARNCRLGSMAAVGMTSAELQPYLQHGVVIACENSFQSTTISGDPEQVDKVIKAISQSKPNVFCRKLRVKVAYHSHHMHELGNAYEEAIKPYINLRKRTVPFFSSVTGSLLEEASKLDATYWRRNLESPVLFSSALSSIVKNAQRNQLFLEIGPHSALAGPIRQIIKSTKGPKESVYVSTLTRGTKQVRNMLETLGHLYSHGASVEIHRLFDTGGRKILMDLPLYPWDHEERYWHETRATQSWRLREFPHHEILGSRLPGSSDIEPVWRNILRLEDVPWIAEHVLCKDIVFPGAGYIAMAGEAIRQITGCDRYVVKNLFLKTPLFLHEMQATEILTSVKPARLTDIADADYYDFTISAYDGTNWIKHCQGHASKGAEDDPEPKGLQPFIRKVSSKFWYAFMAKLGLSYGPRFQGLQNITTHPAEKLAHATSHDDGTWHESHYSIHPTLIDQTLQLMGVAVSRGLTRVVDKLCVPIQIETIEISKATGVFAIEATTNHMSGATMSGNVIATVDSRPVISLKGASFFSIDDSQSVGDSNIPLTSQPQWKPDIDLVPQESLLPFLPQGRKSEIYSNIISLCVIDTALALQDLEPVTDHLKKYKSWVCGMFDQIGTNSEEIWKASQANEWVNVSSEARRALYDDVLLQLKSDDYASLNICALMRQVMDNASDVILGKKQPVEVLFQDEKMKTLYSSTSTSAQFKHLFSLLVHSNPRMRILEIGGGTASTTTIALELLRSSTGVPMFQNYTFTDISAAFLKAAEESFKEHRNMTYKILDIARDPLEQGFDLSSFDLIIASNVMHAIPKLQTGIENVKKLLAPGGRFILQELCPDLPWVDYIMGLLPGWWLGEADGRTERPYVRPERWHNELLEAGLTGIEAQAYDDEWPQTMTASMLTRKPLLPVPDRRVTLVTHSKPNQWIKELENRLLQKEFTVTWGSLNDKQPSTRDVIFLLDLDGPFFHNISEANYESFKTYISACINAHMLWITPGNQGMCGTPFYGLVSGVARSLWREMSLDFATVKVDRFHSTSVDAVTRIYQKFREQTATSAMTEYEYMVSDNVANICRFEWKAIEDHLCTNSTKDTPRKMSMKQLGLIDTIEWTLDDEEELKADEVNVDIAYCGLNFKDIMTSMGVFGSTKDVGIEGSGSVRSIGSNVKNLSVGDEVLLIGSGIMKTRKTVPADRCIKLPADLSLEDAATMPVVFATAIYSLLHLGNLKKGQSVLIHSACGGLGLAAIQVCQVIGAEIYATVGNEEKIAYLEANFGIPRDRVFNSRNDSFLPAVMHATNGKGVNIVLNSLSGKLLHASWRCVAKLGKMIELGKRDLLGHGMLSMDLFLDNRAFFGVDLSTLTEEDPSVFKDLLTQFTDWFKEGKIKPIRPTRVFEAGNIVDAFRYMQKGTHMGKILIKMPQNTSDMVTASSKPHVSLSTERSYLLVGGLGGIGRAVSNFLVEKGARQLIFLSRSAGKHEEHAQFLKELEAQGCQSSLVQGSVQNLQDVQRAINISTKPIAGVIQLSMVLRDQSFSKMTLDDWSAAVDPKVAGTWNLHTATEQCPLDFFIAFGSLSGTCGNTGQANYSAANSFLDEFVQYRRSKGLPASVLNIGAVGDIGFVSQDQKLLDHMKSLGNRLLQEKDITDALEVIISTSSSQKIVHDADSSSPNSTGMVIGLAVNKPLSTLTIRPPWTDDRRFLAYENYELPSSEQSTESDEAGLRDFVGQIETNPMLLMQAETEAKIRRELGKLIVTHTAYGQKEEMTEEEISGIAIDSLMSIEIRNWARRKLSIDIALTEISKAATVGGLARLTVEKLKLKYAPQKQEGDVQTEAVSS